MGEGVGEKSNERLNRRERNGRKRSVEERKGLDKQREKEERPLGSERKVKRKAIKG